MSKAPSNSPGFLRLLSPPRLALASVLVAAGCHADVKLNIFFPIPLPDHQKADKPEFPGPDELEELRERCVNVIEDYRLSIGKEPLKRWEDGEQCADLQAAHDAQVNKAHDGLGSYCADVKAQNVCPRYFNAQEVITYCLPAMWGEGPGRNFHRHGHYINMQNPEFEYVACGFAVDEKGRVWSNQNFK